MIFIRYIFFALLIISIHSCDFINKTQNDSSTTELDRKTIARVNGRTLYLDDIRVNLPESLSTEDSAQYLRHYADRWMRRQIQLREAESHMDPSVDLEKLIQDYRESLILQSYESKLVQNALNTTIRPIEIENYYNAHQEDFALDQPLIQGIFLKLKGSRNQFSDLQDQWSINVESLDVHGIDEDLITAEYQQAGVWFPVSDWLNQIPSSVIDRAGIRKKRFMVKEHDNFTYFIRIDDLLNVADTAPLDNVKEEIREIILHRRKLQLLENNRESLFDQAVQNNLAEIFI